MDSLDRGLTFVNGGKAGACQSWNRRNLRHLRMIYRMLNRSTRALI